MARVNKKSVTGRILLVHEDKFRIVDDTGRGYLFALSHDAPVSGRDLRLMHEAQVPVCVRYEGEPSLDSGIAYEVKIGEDCPA